MTPSNSDKEGQTLPSQKRACPHCGDEISAAATRCKHCLAEVAPPSSTPALPPTSTGPIEPVFTPLAGSTASAASAGAHYRFHVLPFIGTIRSGFFTNDNAQTVSGQLQSLIDHYTQQGWEFYSVEKVDIQVNPGCIGPNARTERVVYHL